MTVAPPITRTRPVHAGRVRSSPPPRERPAMTAPPIAPPYVVGDDLSLTATGIAWPDRAVVHGTKRLTTLPPGPRETALADLAEQLAIINWARNGNDDTWGRTGPDGYPVLVVLENLPTKGIAAMSTEKAYVWHELIRILHRKRVPVLVVAPSVIKKYATGKGNAPKSAVVDATARRMPWYTTLGNEDMCDAAWACAIGCDLLGQPIVEVPKTHRDALAKLVLPEGLR